jgi:predicted XRE-type DNA-binding protein
MSRVSAWFPVDDERDRRRDCFDERIDEYCADHRCFVCRRASGQLRLAHALNQVLEARKLSQADAAKVVTQPRDLRFVTTNRRTSPSNAWVNLLTAHGQDVEIGIRRKPRSRKAVRISVVAT